MNQEKQDIILSVHNLTKIYPGVIALNNVSMSFCRGEIHALVGENGAGKSTLIKCLTGAIPFDRGYIEFNGEKLESLDANISRQLGVEAIYQEFNLIECLSAAENVCLGTRFGKFVDYKKMEEAATDIFRQFKIDIDPTTPISRLTTAQKQIVEISKAVSKGAKFLIMDEPSAPLTVNEIDIMMDIVRKLKSEGVTILYISHRLDEIFQLADRVSVFRDGQYIVTRNVAETDRHQLITDMVGRELSEDFPQRLTPPGEVMLEVKNLTGNGVKNVSFQVRAGEILGLGGLVGSGRSEIMRVVYGMEKKQWGHICIKGKEVNLKSCYDAMLHGIGFVTEDRKKDGCILLSSVEYNLVISTVKKHSKWLFVENKKLREIAKHFVDRIKIRTPSLNQRVLNLSGGNQQKVLVGRVLAAGMDILIFDEPTRGIDVGAKHEIYELMNQLCAEGKAIVMISSDMEELLGMSDRIVVLSEKEYAGEISRSEFSQERVLALASGLDVG